MYVVLHCYTWLNVVVVVVFFMSWATFDSIFTIFIVAIAQLLIQLLKMCNRRASLTTRLLYYCFFFLFYFHCRYFSCAKFMFYARRQGMLSSLLLFITLKCTSRTKIQFFSEIYGKPWWKTQKKNSEKVFSVGVVPLRRENIVLGFTMTSKMCTHSQLSLKLKQWAPRIVHVYSREHAIKKLR